MKGYFHNQTRTVSIYRWSKCINSYRHIQAENFYQRLHLEPIFLDKETARNLLKTMGLKNISDCRKATAQLFSYV